MSGKPNRFCKACRTTLPATAFAGRGRVCIACDWNDPCLPGKPLVAAIERYAHFNQRDITDIVECLGLSARLVFAWKYGARRPRSIVVDSVLVGIDRFYWDVYDETTVRRPLVRVITYQRRSKQGKLGRPIYFLERTGEHDYGDAGPDHEMLEIVKRAFEGGEMAGMLTHTQTEPEPPPPPVQKVKTQTRPGSQAARVLAWLQANGPATTFDIADGLGLPVDAVKFKIRDLFERKHPAIERVGSVPSQVVIDKRSGLRGRDRAVYRAVSS